MANKEQKLFVDFPPVTTEQWEAAIAADLKGADYEKKLVWRTGEGFNVRPYYRAENLTGIKYLGAACGEFPYVRGIKKDNNWKILQTLTVECAKSANEQALKLLSKGVESIGFLVHNKEFSAADLDILLQGIPMNHVEISISGGAAKRIADLFIEKMEREGTDPSAFHINFLIDPIVKKLSLKGVESCPNNECKCAENLASLITRGAACQHARFINVSGEVFHNCGSTIVQELAFTMAVGHEYAIKLMDVGKNINEVATAIRFSMAISSNYFMEIAKFRAARLLWANIIAQYNPSRCCASKMKIHAVTSRWNMTVYDPYVNMLRATTEAMSAAIAGVHSIEVLPFDAPYEQPTEFSARIARNVQLLLKEESHFNQVTDAAGGSYYIENLTNSIAEQAWALFKQVEEKGGYIAAFRAGFISEQIEASAATKNKNIATRRLSLLGTNQFPNFTEVAVPEVTQEVVTPQECKESCCPNNASGDSSIINYKLVPYRGAMAFEQMRLRVDRSGKSPKAFMLTAGSLAFARARAQFSCNFFACAGIRVQDNTYFHSVEEGVKAALEAQAEIVVLCASDDDYATLAPETVKLLGDKAIFVVAGAPACQAELEAQGIHNFISIRSNVLDTLEFYLKALGI